LRIWSVSSGEYKLASFSLDNKVKILTIIG